MVLTEEINRILASSENRGWVLEPDAKNILSQAGLYVPEFRFAKTLEQALEGAAVIGYPLAAKIVSPKALHKSDVGGVAVGLENDDQLKEVFERFSRFEEFMGVHIEAMAEGLELIIGAKIDPQFGPVILMGIGGTSVEIYQDTAIRMPPLTPAEVQCMVDSLQARRLLYGYRGKPAVNMDKLTETLIGFSMLVVEMADHIESIDLNPVMCNADACVIADARIMLK
ncbi:MAG: acetate--CoA ligase family protein [Desulfatitalea sp.]|nr:acetate--CoA ligase family protein [Desulfatitalea sp.]NNJ99244.1 acetate--CoA ligase family protein [Desulfatitalea sp.]